MTELELLRVENRGLRERSETADIALGGFLEASAQSVALLSDLATQLENDEAALAAVHNCAERWGALMEEVSRRMKAFTKLPGTSATN